MKTTRSGPPVSFAQIYTRPFQASQPRQQPLMATDQVMFAARSRKPENDRRSLERKIAAAREVLEAFYITPERFLSEMDLKVAQVYQRMASDGRLDEMRAEGFDIGTQDEFLSKVATTIREQKLGVNILELLVQTLTHTLSLREMKQLTASTRKPIDTLTDEEIRLIERFDEIISKTCDDPRYGFDIHEITVRILGMT